MSVVDFTTVPGSSNTTVQKNELPQYKWLLSEGHNPGN